MPMLSPNSMHRVSQGDDRKLCTPSCHLVRMKSRPYVVTLAAVVAIASAAISPANAQEPETVKCFNGKDLTGWKAADMDYWSVEEGAIVGTAGDQPIKGNQFLWSDVPVKDFYFSLNVKQTPHSANAGIQFRSKPKGRAAVGYQADVGKDCWGKLYHEHGRKMLALSLDEDEKNVKPADWNHYEILAVGHRIWLAINGEITVALRDPYGELKGQIALQIHGGKAQRILYKDLTLVHHPKVTLVGKTEEELDRLLKDAPKMGFKPSSRRPPRPKPAPKAVPSEKESAKRADQTKGVSFAQVATTPFDAPRVPTPQGTHPLTNPLVLPSEIRPIASPKNFTIDANQMVLFLGGTDMVTMGDYGYLESLLTASFAKQKPRFRSMAWEGDTVYSQYRPRAFYELQSRYGQADQRRRVEADIIFVQFGKMESLDATRSVQAFESAYENLVTRLQAYAPRVVLLTPVPFEPVELYNPEQAEREWRARQTRLREFTKSIYRVGSARCCQVVDPTTVQISDGKPANLVNSDGLLTRRGSRDLARLIGKQLNLPDEVLDADLKHLRRTIVHKNQIWFEYWRPTNWAFLYGDRQSQPSSRRYNNRKIRWFPDEVEAVLPHLEKAEQAIAHAASSL